MDHQPAYLFAPHAQPALAVQHDERRFPVHRIFCVGRNYADHAREMGVDPKTTPPVFFMKPATALVIEQAELAFPVATHNLHHEVELAVGLSKGGQNLTLEQAEHCVGGYAVALDMTRRDLQEEAKAHKAPWDVAKGFDQSCPVSPMVLKEHVGLLNHGAIQLSVNGAIRQKADLSDMIWSIPELISRLSRYFTLSSGDIILTGTPAGVGPVKPGDSILAEIDHIGSLQVSYAQSG
jgi:fumarylpyruvate hydrolase